ncbi:MAG TPA: T9SS type A sorting domain-containing protein [Flavisolibacter sp.]|jgi:hypothetical protein|nr:T9SS type A sorting domain-containing protein [Flavisolibacter sp.]
MRSILLFFLLFISAFSHAQMEGDYYSIGIGKEWYDDSTWLRYDGATWVYANSAPGPSTPAYNTVTAYHVGLNSALTLNCIVDVANLFGSGSLTVTGSGSLQLKGNLQMNGKCRAQNLVLWDGCRIGSPLEGENISIDPSRFDEIPEIRVYVDSDFTIRTSLSNPAKKLVLIVNNGMGTIENLGTITAIQNFSITATGFVDLYAGKFINRGTFRKQKGGEHTVLANCDNYGTITMENESGTLRMNELANYSTLEIGTDALVEGNYAWNTGASVRGTGKLRIGIEGQNSSYGRLQANVDFVSPPSLLVLLHSPIMGDANVTINNGLNGALFGYGGGTLTINGDLSVSYLHMERPFVLNGDLTFEDNQIIQAHFILKDFTLKGNTEINQTSPVNFYGNLVNEGTITVNANSRFSSISSGQTFTNKGLIVLHNKASFAIDNFQTTSTASLTGNGVYTLPAAFINNGTIAPGQSPGKLTFVGQPFSAGTGTEMEIQDGSGSGTGHDAIVVQNAVSLAGTLKLTEIGGAVPDGTYTILSLTTGTISGSFSTVTLPPGYTIHYETQRVQVVKATTPLPVTFLSFTAANNVQGVLLRWKTTAESNVSHYAVQRSADGMAFTTLAQQPAAGTLSGTYQYTYNDRQPLSPSGYYRIQTCDRDGKITYSVVVSMQSGAATLLRIYPNPATDLLSLQTRTTDGRLTITNMAGRIVKSMVLPKNETLSTSIGIADLAPGLYIIQSGTTRVKFLKQ